MAKLTEEEREAAWAKYMSDASRLRQPITMSKPELRAVFDAVDDLLADVAPEADDDALGLDDVAKATGPQVAAILDTHRATLKANLAKEEAAILSAVVGARAVGRRKRKPEGD